MNSIKKITSFGTMETLLERDGQVVSELFYFEKEGRGHTHNQWEHCFVTKGKGLIVVGDENIEVQKGTVCSIPPNTNHWMIPKPSLEILLVYSNSKLV